MENAKKNLVFHFGVGRHASFPQKPVVKKNRNKKGSLAYRILARFGFEVLWRYSFDFAFCSFDFSTTYRNLIMLLLSLITYFKKQSSYIGMMNKSKPTKFNLWGGTTL